MTFGSTQSLLIIGTFAAVILITALDVLDIAVTALLGLCLLLVTGALDDRDLLNAFRGGVGNHLRCCSVGWWWRGY